MKFRDGYWDLRDGLSLLNRVDVRDVEATDSELIVFSSTRKVLGRGELTKNLTVAVQKLSKSAAEKIARAGGTVEEA